MNRMTRKKKSGFLTFCFSFLPGAGEMYLGFMKMGISLMGLFFALITLAVVLNIPAILFIMVVVWFYSFFHVHNLAGLTDEEFLDTEDEFLFNLDFFFHLDEENVEKYRKTMAVILIVVGVLLLWNGIEDAFFVYLPDVVWRFISRMEHSAAKILAGVAIIAGGIHMIKGKKEELKEVIIDVGMAEDACGSDAEGGKMGSGDAGYRGMGGSDAGYGGMGRSDAEYGEVGRGDAGYSGVGGSDAGYGEMGRSDAGYGEMGRSDMEYGRMGNGMGSNGAADGMGNSMGSDGERESRYGMNVAQDTEADGVQERSGYGEGQDH